MQRYPFRTADVLALTRAVFGRRLVSGVVRRRFRLDSVDASLLRSFARLMLVAASLPLCRMYYTFLSRFHVLPG